MCILSKTYEYSFTFWQTGVLLSINRLTRKYRPNHEILGRDTEVLDKLKLKRLHRPASADRNVMTIPSTRVGVPFRAVGARGVTNYAEL